MNAPHKPASTPPPSQDTAKEYQQLLRGQITSKQYVEAVRSAVRARHSTAGRFLSRKAS
jgi:hypothetical protein